MSAIALADAIERRVQTAFQSMLPEQAVVTALDAVRREVTVDVAGQTRVYNYTGTTYYPNVGDLVWIGGPPDARYVMGRINNGVRVYERIETAQLDIALTRQVDADAYRVAIFSANPDGSYSAGTATEITTTPLEGYPIIVAPDQDVALVFFNGALYATNPGNTERRDVHARELYSDGNVNALGASLGANGVLTPGPVNCGPVGASYVTTDGLTCTPTGAFLNGLEVGVGGILNHGTYAEVPSERHLKRDLTERTGMLAEVVAAPIYDFRYRPDAFEGVDSERWRVGPVVDELPDDCTAETEYGRVPEMASRLNRAWGAIRELDAKVDAQAEQIAALTARLDAIEEAR